MRDRTDESTLQNVKGGCQYPRVQRDAPEGFASVKVFEVSRSCVLFAWTCRRLLPCGFIEQLAQIPHVILEENMFKYNITFGVEGLLFVSI